MKIRPTRILCALTAALLSALSVGCSFLISLDEVEHFAADSGAAEPTPDVSATPDVSMGTSDAGAADVSAGPVDATADQGMVGSRSDAAMVGNDATAASDAGPSEAGTCVNPMYPVPCPGRGSLADGGVPPGCWTTGTDCTTVTNCAGTYHGCVASRVFDCATNRCILTCNDPMYPVLCPAVGAPDAGGTTAGCWTADTDCASVKNCSGTEHACRTGYRYDCGLSQCVLTSDAGDASPPLVCDGGQTNCSGRCADLQTNATSCGSCTHACAGGQQCSAGQCCTPSDAGGSCRLPACGCGVGSVCYPDTPATGLHCLVSDSLTEGADCTGALSVCASGLGCFGGVCRPYCGTNADCPSVDGVRACQQTTWSDGSGSIPGVFVCRRICDPVSPQSPRAPLLACPPGFGCFADVAPGASSCIPGGAGVIGDTCSFQSDCAPGHYCSSGGVCNRYCFSTADCAPGSSCFSFDTREFAASREVGFCFSTGAFDGGVLD